MKRTIFSQVMSVALAVAVLLGGVGVAGAARPVVALLTDFGTQTEAVGLCHGAILAQSTDIEVVDLSHSVPPYDVRVAAHMLWRTAHFPAGAVIVAVVDPGVGTERRAIAMRTKTGLYYVGPDNGIFTLVMRSQGVREAVLLDPKVVNPEWTPGTFDGRDLFAPAGARLALSGGNLAGIGQPIKPEELKTLDMPDARFDGESGELHGIYLRTDEPYGNLWTNIGGDLLTSAGIRQGHRLRVTGPGFEIEVPMVLSFGDVAEGEALAYINSAGELALAVNLGDFREKYRVEPGAALVVRKVSVSGGDGASTASAAAGR